MQLKLNSDALVKHTARLERMSRSALPVAVRSTLNSAAYDVKKRTMPASAKATFTQRKPSFFKASSKVAPATGFDIAGMKATVGFVSKGGTDKSVEDLQQQEHGSSIDGRSFVPRKEARTGGSWTGNVRAAARISDIRNRIVDSANGRGRSNKEKYIRSALHAGKGGFVIGTGKNGRGSRTLYRIRSIVRKGARTIVNSQPLFSVKGGRLVKPKATHFMEKASLQSADLLNQYFITHATKQLDKIK